MNQFDDGRSPAQFGDMVKAVEGLNLELIQGEVLMVYPGLGVYLVLPKHGDAKGSLIMCCSMSGSIGRSGVHGGDIYEAGDDVLVAKQRDVVQMAFGSKAISDVGYILCAAPPDFMVTAQGTPGANIHGEKLDYFNQTVTDAFASTKQLAGTLLDISYGMPNDIFGGDFVKYGSLYTFFTICATKASLGASPMAMVEAFAFHDKVRITARKLEERGMAVESGREPDTDAMLYYKRMALREREGLGAVGDVAPFVKPNPDIIQVEQAEETQLGVFRHTSLAGEMADGELDAIVKPSEEDGTIHTTDQLPPTGMVSVRKTYDGRHETRAAGGIDHVKSLYIPVPEQIKPHDADTPDDVEPQSPYSERETDADKPFSAFASTLEHEEFDEDTANYRNMRIGPRSDYWRLMTRQQLAEVYPDLDVENAPKQLEQLDNKKPFYEEPPYVQELDPVTQLERRLYALESIIRQQPDGSIAISDGNGSEILMHRGRISISPAADLELRPGRDCLELVPRRKVINAGEEVQLVSNDGKIRIKAETDMDFLSGNGGTGRMLFENRVDTGIPSNLGGIVIRTESDLRMVGNNLYVGIAPPINTPSDSGLDRKRGGALIIDARSGSLGLHGARMYGRFTNGVSLSSGNALMSVVGGIFTVVANTTQFATGPFTIGTIEEGSVQQSVLDEHGVSTQDIQSRGNPFVQVNGSILADGAVFQGVVAASNVNATSAAFGNASLTSGLYSPGIEPPELKVDPFSAEYLGILSDSYAATVPEDLTDGAINEGKFGFDKPDEVDQADFYMHEMRWQAMLGVGGASSYWEPRAVKNSDDEDTYAYPGHGGDAAIVQDSKFAKKPLNEYIVNR